MPTSTTSSEEPTPKPQPRCGIVRLSSLVKENRWDPAYYLGPTPEHDNKIQRAKRRIKDAQRALANAVKEKQECQDRADKHLQDGTVRLIQVDGGTDGTDDRSDHDRVEERRSERD